MSTTVQAVEVVQSAYAAFGRGDVSAILSLIADEVEWKFCGAKGLPYTGTFRTKDEIAKWFASIPEVEDILVFEPREFISRRRQRDGARLGAYASATQRKAIRDRMGSHIHSA